MKGSNRVDLLQRAKPQGQAWRKAAGSSNAVREIQEWIARPA